MAGQLPHVAQLLVPYASLLAVIVAVVFGTLTLRQWQQTRYLTAAAELVHTIQTEQFGAAIALIVELPAAVPAERIHSDKQLASAVYTVTHVFESLGVLVYHRVLKLHLVDHLVGGYVRSSWKRLGPYLAGRREQLAVDTLAEWYQWLAERLDQYPAPGKDRGAHVAFRNWKP